MSPLPGHEHRCGVPASVNRWAERADITCAQIEDACDAALFRRLGFIPDVSVRAVMRNEIRHAESMHQP